MRRAITAAAVFAAAGALALFALSRLGLWLLVADPEPESIGVIFTFGGERAREIYSLELATRHPEATWIISGRYWAPHARWLTTSGIDTNRVVFVDSCSNTAAEVAFLEAWVGQSVALQSGEATEARRHGEEESGEATEARRHGEEESGEATEARRHGEGESGEATEARRHGEERVRAGGGHRGTEGTENVGSGEGRREAGGRGQRAEVGTRNTEGGNPRVAQCATVPPVHSPVVLVSGPYHMRRIAILAGRAQGLRGLDIRYLPVPLEQLGQTRDMYARWWRWGHIRGLVWMETKKIVAALAGR